MKDYHNTEELHRTHRGNRLLLVLLLIIALNMLLVLKNVYAETKVKLKVDPDIRTVVVGSGEITIVAEPDILGKSGLQFEWSLRGPGQLVGSKVDPGLFYIPPDTVDEKSARAVVSVIVSDDKGNQATNRVVFTLVAPEPTPAPSLPSFPIKLYIKGMGEAEQPTTSQQIVNIEVAGYLSESKLIQVYPNQWSQVEFELQLLSNSLLNLSSPSRPPLPKGSLKQLQQRLSEYFKMYKELIEKEQQGDNIDTQIIPILNEISKEMKQIESIYEQVYEQLYEPLFNSVSEMSQRITRLKDSRESIENELLYRQQTLKK